MSISDLSQLSDLSGISRIRSSSIRPWDRGDSIFSLSEVRASSSIREPTSNKSIVSGVIVDGSTNASKISKAIVACGEAINDFTRLELIKQSLQEAASTESKTLQISTATKLKEILDVHEVKKYLQLPKTDKNIHKDLMLLNIIDDHLTKTQLNHDEKREVNAAVVNKLREKINHFIVSYEKQGGNVEDAIKNDDLLSKSCLTENHGSDLMRWKDQTDEICGEYDRDLLRCADLIYHWQLLKYNDMRELNLKTAENLLLEAQVAELQAKMATKLCALKMFKETPKTVDAFRILSENLDAKILETREQFRKKKALKIMYQDVFTAGYDQVLNKYKELINVIKKKERLMEML